MMNNGNEQAYPILESDDAINFHSGLTKREHFAGLAMAAWIQHHGSKDDYGYSDKSMAESAVVSADALLKELAK